MKMFTFCAIDHVIQSALQTYTFLLSTSTHFFFLEIESVLCVNTGKMGQIQLLGPLQEKGPLYVLER